MSTATNRELTNRELNRQIAYQTDGRPYGLYIRQQFMGEKRNLQLAVKKLHDALTLPEPTAEDQRDLRDMVGMAELLQEFNEETFRAACVSGVAYPNANEDAAWWAANAHGDAVNNTPGGVCILFRGEYLLMAAIQDVLGF